MKPIAIFPQCTLRTEDVLAIWRTGNESDSDAAYVIMHTVPPRYDADDGDREWQIPHAETICFEFEDEKERNAEYDKAVAIWADALGGSVYESDKP